MINSDLFNRLLADQAGFHTLSRLLESWTGNSMEDSEKNRALMANRLTRIMINRRFDSYQEYSLALKKRYPIFIDSKNELVEEFIDRLTTHTTRFFRDPQQWEQLRNQVTGLLGSSKWKCQPRSFRILSLGCSTGQEAYSFGIFFTRLFEELGLQTRPEVIGVDISRAAIKWASRGIYRAADTKLLPSQDVQRFFSTVSDSESSGHKKVTPELSLRTRFLALDVVELLGNSKRKSPLGPEPFDLIGFRNVLYYLPESLRRPLAFAASKLLGQTGIIFTSAVEAPYFPPEALFGHFDRKTQEHFSG